VAELTIGAPGDRSDGAKAVLLTGGTGFVGAQIARRIISNTNLAIASLVRADNAEDAIRKARREWWAWPELRDEPGGRVKLILGDVSRPNLGLPEGELGELVRGVSHVVHAAADLRLDGPIDAMRMTNVAGTMNVIDFASRANEDHGLQRFSYISTAYVAGGRRGLIPESDLTDEHGFHNTYELTKFEAERLVREAGARLPISIFRPGMIVGDSLTGEVRTFNTIYYPLRLYFEHGIRVVPISSSSKINIVPVDYVADSIVRLTQMSDAEGLTFQLTAPFETLPTIGGLVESVRQWARENMRIDLPRVMFLPLGQPRTSSAKELTTVEGKNQGPAGKLGELEGYCSKDMAFRRDNTDRLLGPYGLDWREYLPRLLTYAVYHGFIHPYPRTVHETILHRLEGRSIPVSISDVIDGRVVRRDPNQVREQMLSASGALRRMGVAKGDKVGIVGLNSSRYLVLDVAIGLAGAVSVPIYYTSPPREIRDILTESGAMVVLVGAPDVLKQLDEVDLDIPVVSFCREEPSELRLKYESWEEFLKKGAEERVESEVSPVGFGDLATIRYTSGTTGRPKGVCFDHGNLRWMGEAVCSLFPWRARSKEITYLSFLPMNHCVEGVICAYAPYYAPASLDICFLEEFKQLRKALPLVRPTVFFSVPRFYEKAWETLVLSRMGRTFARSRGPLRALMRPLIRRTLLSRSGLSRCSQLMVGSAPVSRTLLEEFNDLGIEIHDAYGLTEAPLVTMNLPGRNRVGTVGEPLPETSVKISEGGEIMVKGPQVAKAYSSGELELEGGYLATGDLGKIDAGYLIVDGRKKELIKTSYGKYVQPAKIEGMLRSIENVEEAMVVGEGRPFCVALIWVKKGTDRVGASRLIDEAISQMNKGLSHPEQIRRWATLENDLSVSGGDLTPNLKLKRAVVCARFKDAIEGLFSGHLPAEAANTLLEVPAHA